MMRTICKSRTYQHSIQTNPWNKDDEINYAHAVPGGCRPRCCTTPSTGRPARSASCRACRPGRGRPSCSTPPRTCRAASSTCSASRRARAPASASAPARMMLGPVLNMVNGPVVADAIKDPNNRIAKLLTDGEGRRQGRRGTVPGRPVPAADAGGAGGGPQGAQGRRGRLRRRPSRSTTSGPPSWPPTRRRWTPSRRSGRRTCKTAPAWTVLDVGQRQVDRRRDADQAARRLDPGHGAEPVPGDVHADGQDEADRRHGDPPGGAAGPSLPAQGPGRAPNGNFVLNEFKVDGEAGGGDGRLQAGGAAERPGRLLAGQLGGGRRHRRQRGDRLGDVAAVRQAAHGRLRDQGPDRLRQRRRC